MALYRAMRLRFGYGFRIVRCQRPVKRQKYKPCETQARFLPPLLLVGSKELVLKAPKQGQFHAANICDNLTPRFVCPRSTRERDGIAAKLLRCGITSEALRRNIGSALTSGKFTEPQTFFCRAMFMDGFLAFARAYADLFCSGDVRGRLRRFFSSKPKTHGLELL